MQVDNERASKKASYEDISGNDIFFKDEIIANFFRKITTRFVLGLERQKSIVTQLFNKAVYKGHSAKKQEVVSLYDFVVYYDYFVFRFVLKRSVDPFFGENWVLDKVLIDENLIRNVRLKFNASRRTQYRFQWAYEKKHSAPAYFPDSWLGTMVHWIKTGVLKEIIFIKSHFRFIFEKESEDMSFIVAENNLDLQWEIIGCKKLRGYIENNLLRTRLA